MIISLVGPMSGIRNFNYPKFNAVARRLRALGHEVINPAENGVCDSWAAYMRLSIAGMMRCEIIGLIDGWEKSRGALIEIGLARELEIPVRMVDTIERYSAAIEEAAP